MQTEAHRTQRQDRYRLELGLKEHLKNRLFLKCSFRQDGRTNQRGSENGGAQTEKRSCWGWHFGHELSILGKQMNDEREKNDDDKTKRKQARWAPAYDKNYIYIYNIYRRCSFLLPKFGYQPIKQFWDLYDGASRKQSDMGLIYLTQTIHYLLLMVLN